jgi:hypothetical protein
MRIGAKAPFSSGSCGHMKIFLLVLAAVAVILSVTVIIRNVRR